MYMRMFKKPYIKHLLALSIVVLGYIYSDSVKNNTQTQPDIKRDTISKISNIATSSSTFPVLHVVDGDTFLVSMNGVKETIRLIGIDTPEVVDLRRPVQCFGREASNKAKELLTGKTVTLTNDPTQGERDKYNRLLRYAFLDDGTNLNEFMIKEGYAHEYTYQSNPYAFQTEFKAAETYAREHKKGLWADGVCATSGR